MAILYSLVARGKVVLAEYTSTSGNFPTVTRFLLAKIPDHDGRRSIVYDKHVFHYLVEDGVVFLCMVDDNEKRRLAFLFLDEIKRRFAAAFGESAKTAIAFSLNEAFSPTLKSLMEFYNSDPSADTLTALRSKIDDTKNIMIENIDSVLQRGEKIELLVDKTDRLNQQAFRFQKESRRLRVTMWWRRVSTYMAVAFVVALIIFFITVMGCGGFSFKKCKAH